MPLRNCKRCGAVFSQINASFCPKCIQKEEKEYILAKQWLLNNPGHTIESLSKNTGIDKKDILKWIREERLEMTAAGEFVKCKKCGKPIRTGNFCDRCKLGLSRDVKNGIKAIQEEKKAMPEEVKGMYYYPPLEREKRSKS